MEDEKTRLQKGDPRLPTRHVLPSVNGITHLGTGLGLSAASGGQTRKLYSSAVADDATKEKRFKLIIKSKGNQTGEEIKQVLKSRVHPTKIKVGINPTRTLRGGRILVETGSKEEAEKLKVTINEQCCQQLEQPWNPNVVIYNIPEDITLNNAEEVITTEP